MGKKATKKKGCVPSSSRPAPPPRIPLCEESPGSPTSCYMVKAKLGKRWLDFLVDSGAPSTTISIKTAKKCGLLKQSFKPEASADPIVCSLGNVRMVLKDS